MNHIFDQIFNNGIPVDVVYFLISIPFVAMIGAFGRYILGMKLMPIYVMISLTYIIGFIARESTLISIAIGFIISFIIYYLSYFLRKFASVFRLHNLARIAFILTLISIVFLGILLLAGHFPNIVNKLTLNELKAFPIIVIMILSEFFSSHQIQKGIKVSQRAFFHTILLATVTALILSINSFEAFLISQPYIIITFILMIIIIGKYRGLRLAEKFRFGDINSEDKAD